MPTSDSGVSRPVFRGEGDHENGGFGIGGRAEMEYYLRVA
jgi:hypothetical protein